MAKFLVTGGGGFIGSNLSERLVRKGHGVRILDNFSTGRRENLLSFQDRIEVIEGDLRNPGKVREAVKGVDFVLHQGALPSVVRSIENPLECTEVNVGGTLNLLWACRREGIKRVVYASSSSVYGDSEVLPKVETHLPNPLSPYAASKLAGEHYCSVFTRVYGLETVSLRYFNVFGSRQDPVSQYAAVIPRFITALIREEAPEIYGDGEQTRDFTYIDNVVEANIQACFREGVAGNVFNIACGERVSLNQLLEILRAVTGSAVEPRHSPPRPGDIRHSLADISKAQGRLGYSLKVDLREGLRRTVKWYGENPSQWEGGFLTKGDPEK